MESYSSSSNSSDNSDDDSSPPRSKYVHSWSSRPSSKDSKIRPRPRITGPVINNFKNDGSFLEMFKKMQEQNSQNPDENKSSPNSDEVPTSNSLTTGSSNDNDTSSSSKANKPVGKRRPARVLPTGLVKKQRKSGQPVAEEEKVERKNDPWSKYMDEVKKYKQQSCTDEESSRRPLVK